MSSSPPSIGDVSLEDKYVVEHGDVFLSGVQACVRVVLDRLRTDRSLGMHTAALVSGYQGSPLGGFDRELARRTGLAPDAALVHHPGLNEELAATSVWGSQLATQLPQPRYSGVVGVWYGKNPGLDRASDAIRHGNYVGTDPGGGVLAFVGDDPSCKSSSLPSAAERTLEALAVPTFFPGTLQEVLEFGHHAVECSRTSGLWSAMKITTNVADGTGTVSLDAVGRAVLRPELTWRGTPYRHRPSGHLLAPVSVEMEESLFGVRLPLALDYGRLNRINEIPVDPPVASMTIIASGKTFYDVSQALKDLGLDRADLEAAGVRVLRIGMPFPLDEHIIRVAARGVGQVLVIEEKAPWLERLVRDALFDAPDRPEIVGKSSPKKLDLPMHGELDRDVIAGALHRFLSAAHPALRLREPREHVLASLLDLPVRRTPAFCSGCPHNRSTDAPDGAQVGVGIGCHTMVIVNSADKGDLVGMTQMGGEGAQWLGIAPFTGTPHFVQNIGDGTFHHSGSLAIRAAVAANANITFKLLYNGSSAMTGAQDVEGMLSVPRLTELLASEGVRRIVVTTDQPERYRGVKLSPITTVSDRNELLEAQKMLAGERGVTVLIHDQYCAAEKRRLRKRGKIPGPQTAVHINERVCEGCGDCGKKSDCLSVQPVETEFGRKTQIHQASCNSDLSCLEGDCPSFITVVQDEPRKPRPPKHAPKPPLVPPPTVTADTDDFSMRIIGIGGTGIVTVSQLVGMAAMLDGLQSWNLDQTGLSQKAGPVVSDIRISRNRIAGSNKAGRAVAVDLYLAADVLGAATSQNLSVLSPDRSTAVVSTSEVPTAAMITNPALTFPDKAVLRNRIESNAQCAFFVDARETSEVLFDDDMPANALLLGAAFQAGTLPLSIGALRRAIELNGVAVETNLAAFEWGRVAVAQPHQLPQTRIDPSFDDVTTPTGLTFDLPSPLQEVVERRAQDLTGYQGRRYAKRYVDAVRQVSDREFELTGERTDVGQAFARGLHKLMAYKDEYEVARLHLDSVERARVEKTFGPNAKIYFNLHPPALRALGLKRKLKLGPWCTPLFRILRALRVVRGTPFDLMGYAKVRRIERALPDEYCAIVHRALDGLTPESHGAVAEVCDLAQMVRGYESVKLANIATFRVAAADSLENLAASAAREEGRIS